MIAIVAALAIVASTVTGGSDAVHTSQGDRGMALVLPLRISDERIRTRPIDWADENSPDYQKRQTSAHGHVLRIHGLAVDGVATPEPVATATAIAIPVSGVTPIPEPSPNPLSIPERICLMSWDCGTAIRVAECESTFRPWVDNGVHIGLFQINWQLHGDRLYPGESLYDADTNIRVAHDIWLSEGWIPWNASRHCWGG